jgi:hypothetical protein
VLISMQPPDRDVQGLDARLLEIDRRLAEIQADLGPAKSSQQREPEPEPKREPDPEPDHAAETKDPDRPPERSGPLADVLQNAARPRTEPDERLGRRIEQLVELHMDLLASMRDVAAGFQRAFAEVPRSPEGEVTVSAGPFPRLEAVHEFERSLAELPDVKGVALRGYAGSDRAVIDVQLS